MKSGIGDLPEPSEHSFIIKVWLEETAAEAGKAIWRGHITHVLSSERKYIQSLNGITDFIIPYLEHIGVDFSKEKAD